ncbi:GGDEF domain-containing protein [Exiguobacterium sp. SL-10]|uniref:GGDEF domain-containing protein n=1 Tax=Exiguobacterium sp. SL-10 TaxID=2510962 RepID=UPI00103D8565|nr:GGDEF domain-containing protein [Exiguobacterium sp. SL-10]TCI30199.1 GGDEF domain-containing protein [Exiguobacterium sp. SL-10]
MGQVVNIFFINISIIYLLVSLTFYLMRHLLPIQPASPLAVRVWFGISNGIIAILLTINSFMVEAARIDLRVIPLALAAAYAGPIGVAVTIVLMLGGRFILDGMTGQVISSFGTLALFPILALVLSRLSLRRGHLYAVYLVFGTVLVLFRIAGNVPMHAFMTVFLPYFVLTFLGGWVCYWVAKQIETHLRMFRLHTQRATIDELTGLPNRYMTLERLNEVEMSGLPWALFVIDVDRFKQLNDTYGHRAGDAALHHIGQTLRTNCPVGGFVGRYGGEEFLMVLEDVGDVRTIADGVVAVVRDTPFSFEGTEIPMTVSLGASLAGAEPGTLVFERADAALYQAKTSGRDQAKIG